MKTYMIIVNLMQNTNDKANQGVLQLLVGDDPPPIGHVQPWTAQVPLLSPERSRRGRQPLATGSWSEPMAIARPPLTACQGPYSVGRLVPVGSAVKARTPARRSETKM
jgi:hypothetical protein